MSEIEEVAKAAAEASKFGAQAIKTTERLAAFLARVLGQPIRDAVGIVGDRLKFLRWQRQVRIVDEANQILAERSIQNTKAVPPKLALPILESASLEENDELQDLWIRLLSNAMDPEFEGEVRYALIDIIKSLTPLDTKIQCLQSVSCPMSCSGHTQGWHQDGRGAAYGI